MGDGSILVGGNATSGDSRRAGFIAWISPDRKQRKFIQTEPFQPEAVTLAADGTIWAAGLIFDGKEGWHNVHNVIQRYDSNGKLLSSLTVPDARASTDREELHDADELSDLAASKDRVGWLTNGTEYIEFSLDGSMLPRLPAPAEIRFRNHGFALSDDNDVFVAGRSDLVLALNRAEKSWVKISIPELKTGKWSASIKGADGMTLVIAQEPGVLRRFTIVPPANRTDSAAAKPPKPGQVRNSKRKAS